jgi:hypothetical protein
MAIIAGHEAQPPLTHPATWALYAHCGTPSNAVEHTVLSTSLLLSTKCSVPEQHLLLTQSYEPTKQPDANYAPLLLCSQLLLKRATVVS